MINFRTGVAYKPEFFLKAYLCSKLFSDGFLFHFDEVVHDVTTYDHESDRGNQTESCMESVLATRLFFPWGKSMTPALIRREDAFLLLYVRRLGTPFTDLKLGFFSASGTTEKTDAMRCLFPWFKNTSINVLRGKK